MKVWFRLPRVTRRSGSVVVRMVPIPNATFSAIKRVYIELDVGTYDEEIDQHA